MKEKFLGIKKALRSQKMRPKHRLQMLNIAYGINKFILGEN